MKLQMNVRGDYQTFLIVLPSDKVGRWVGSYESKEVICTEHEEEYRK